MSELERQNSTLDRREFLKIMGSAGATAVFVSACAPVELGQAPAAPAAAPATAPEAMAAPPGMKVIYVHAEGPGDNMDWQYGDAVKFLPPEEIPAGSAADLLASLPKEKLATIYQRMVSARKWETRMKDLFTGGQEGLYGAFHVYIGEEAIANGVMAALRDDDYIVSTHRGHGHLIAKGGDLNKMSGEIYFKETGANKGYGGSMHIVEVDKGILGMNGIVGASYYIAAGAAYGTKVRGTDQVAVAFAGDGAANSVYYFSAVRNATLYDLPVIFVIENNFQMINVPMATVTPTKQIADYTKGLGIPSVVVDGNDVAAVYAATQEAVTRARAGEGPSMIEAMTYRWYDHAGFGGAEPGVDAAWGLPYRTDEEVKQWMARDPIARYKAFLLDRGLLTESELANVDDEVQAAVDGSIEFARQSPSCHPEQGCAQVYAEGTVRATQFLEL
jgi:TPP-dependent pyruvate/acetoin dehydrogenase alpha subunit